MDEFLDMNVLMSNFEGREKVTVRELLGVALELFAEEKAKRDAQGLLGTRVNMEV